MAQFDWHKVALWALLGLFILMGLAGCDIRDVVDGASEGAAAGGAVSGGNPFGFLIGALIGALGGFGAENTRKRKQLKDIKCEHRREIDNLTARFDKKDTEVYEQHSELS